MMRATLQVEPILHPVVLEAVERLRQASSPPLADPAAPVRLTDLPVVWQAHLLDHLPLYRAVLSPGREEIERSDWTRLLDLVAGQLDHGYRLAGFLALGERGPRPEDLAEAPVLSRWSPAVSSHGGFVLTGHVTGHPSLRETWIHTSPLMALDPHGAWAHSWSRWYRLGEPMWEEDRSLVLQARVAAWPIETDDVEVARHFASIRARVARMIEPLSEQGS